MTKNLLMVSHKNYNLNTNEGFVMFLTSKLITCFIDGFTTKRKSQSIVYFLNGSEHIYWVLDFDNEVHSIRVYEQERPSRFHGSSQGRGRPGSGFFVVCPCVQRSLGVFRETPNMGTHTNWRQQCSGLLSPFIVSIPAPKWNTLVIC